MGKRSESSTGYSQPDQRWLKIVEGPFFLRRKLKTLHGKNFCAGSPADELLSKAAQFYPYPDVTDPNPITISIKEGEVFLWVQWVFSTGGRGHITLANYPADTLEDVDAILRDVLAHQKTDGAYPDDQKTDARTACERLKFIWNSMKREFEYAIQADAGKLYARIGDPTASFAAVPPDVFSHYRVTSWSLGRAEPKEGHAPILYSLHFDPGDNPIPSRSSPPEVIGGGSIVLSRSNEFSRQNKAKSHRDSGPSADELSAKKQERDILTREILNALGDGSLGISEAQNEALKHGLRALVREPRGKEDFSIFEEAEPARKERWTLPMAVAWIADRSIESVLRQMDSWASRSHYLVDPDTRLHYGPTEIEVLTPQKKRGYFVQYLKTGSLIRLLHFRPGAEKYVNAKKELWSKLDAGSIEARGVRHPTGERTLIDRHQWQDLEVQSDERSILANDDILKIEHLRNDTGSEIFYEVTIEREALLMLWKPREPEKQPALMTRQERNKWIKELTPFFRQYVERLRNHPAHPIPTCACDKKVIETLAGQPLPRAVWLTIRNAVKPEEWSKPGNSGRISFEDLAGLNPAVSIERIKSLSFQTK